MTLPVAPTGTCFDDALDFIEQVAREQGLPGPGSTSAAVLQATFARMRVVHGICIDPSGTPYAHAWVEQDGTSVWQGGIAAGGVRVFYRQPLADFTAAHPVRECTWYTVAQALQLNRDHDHYGPWEARYRALAGER